jgi:hypothetical protein
LAIERIWHGWTIPAKSDDYQALLHREVFPGIEAKGIKGYLGIRLLRRDLPDEVEFVTIMTFASIDSVIEFQGPDYDHCYVPHAARQILARWDERAAHYEVIEMRKPA